MADDPFYYTFRVRYGECDAQKVVFNARWGDYVDIAVAELMRAIGFESEMVSGELDYQLVKQTTEWRAPARYDDVLRAAVSVVHLGRTSFTLAVAFSRLDEAAVIVRSETVYVCVDHANLAKKPLSDRLRSGLTDGAAGKGVSHVGVVTHGTL